MTHVFVYLVLASNVSAGSSWNVTPMPNMDVCEQFMQTINQKMNSPVRRSNLVSCIEAKTDKPINEVVKAE
ncbi:TPA: hypothetical protein N3I44_005648 [Klebsiella quasipneumoniae]|uniref:hypothetical protein n=1 Tax=Klebsiella quasipneumoniae TaxID=1463165 RepID=UPI0038905CF7|nr:hypothetical protein [Klebsiella quasipneumoniae subsp. similipneumoniae]HCB3648802.1 hypothetical protein [Klebsiella pneumoniae]HCM3836630.1 hypothetical protein [Klebsiella quasipneumoniae]HCB3670731.1 hypothetical protein [Klebsiella pneumoniae]HCM5416385.1 hypothetical protein [Klebsiella pneumoniae]